VLQGRVSRARSRSPRRCRGRRRGQQGLDLVLVQVGHRVRGGLLERDVQDPAAQLRVPGVLVGDVGEEAVDRDQPAVPGGRAVFPVGLEVGQERQHGVGAGIGELEAEQLAAAVACCEPEEELDRVPVGVDGVLADVALRREVVPGETAEQARNRGLRAHDWSPAAGSRASANAWKRVFASCRRAVVMRR
jgi:hypothetical protein